jgi:hypothetical protein
VFERQNVFFNSKGLTCYKKMARPLGGQVNIYMYICIYMLSFRPVHRRAYAQRALFVTRNTGIYMCYKKMARPLVGQVYIYMYVCIYICFYMYIIHKYGLICIYICI